MDWEDLLRDVELFSQFRQDRIYAAGLESLSAEYKTAKSEAVTIRKSLLKSLPDNLKNDLYAYLDAVTSSTLASNNLFYRRGFKDCLEALLVTSRIV